MFRILLGLLVFFLSLNSISKADSPMVRKSAICNYAFNGQLLHPEFKDFQVTFARSLIMDISVLLKDAGVPGSENLEDGLVISTEVGSAEIDKTFTIQQMTHVHIRIDKMIDSRRAELAYARLPLNSLGSVQVDYNGISVSCRTSQ